MIIICDGCLLSPGKWWKRLFNKIPKCEKYNRKGFLGATHCTDFVAHFDEFKFLKEGTKKILLKKDNEYIIKEVNIKEYTDFKVKCRLKCDGKNIIPIFFTKQAPESNAIINYENKKAINQGKKNKIPFTKHHY